MIYMWDGKTESYLTVSGLETIGYPTTNDFPSQGDSEKVYVDQSTLNRYSWAIDQQSDHYLDIQTQKRVRILTILILLLLWKIRLVKMKKILKR